MQIRIFLSEDFDYLPLSQKPLGQRPLEQYFSMISLINWWEVSELCKVLFFQRIFLLLLLYTSVCFIFYVPHVSVKIKYLSFSFWLISLSMMFSGSPIYYIFFIHSSVNGHLGCFHISAIVNSAAVNIRLHVSFQISVKGSFVFIMKGYMLIKTLKYCRKLSSPIIYLPENVFIHLFLCVRCCVVVSNLTFTKERSSLCFVLLGGNLYTVSFEWHAWESIFVCPGALGCQIVTV